MDLFDGANRLTACGAGLNYGESSQVMVAVLDSRGGVGPHRICRGSGSLRSDAISTRMSFNGPIADLVRSPGIDGLSDGDV
jgi:hypothetical protein